MIQATVTALLRALRRGEAPTWFRESRESLARRTLCAETARLEPSDPARAFVVNLGPGVGQDYAAGFLRYLEGRGPLPSVPAGLPRQSAATTRALLNELVVNYAWRL